MESNFHLDSLSNEEKLEHLRRIIKEAEENMKLNASTLDILEKLGYNNGQDALFSAYDIGKATVPKSDTLTKKEALRSEKIIIENDSEIKANAKSINIKEGEAK